MKIIYFCIVSSATLLLVRLFEALQLILFSPGSYRNSELFRNRIQFRSSRAYMNQRRKRVLPSAEDIYIKLTDDQLAIIGRSRLLQNEEDEKYKNSPKSAVANDENKMNESNEYWKAYICEQKLANYQKRVSNSIRQKIHPELELSNIHHIPPHIVEFDEKVEANNNIINSYLTKTKENSNGGPYGIYLANVNITHLVASHRIPKKLNATGLSALKKFQQSWELFLK